MQEKKYRLKNVEDNTIIELSIKEILEEINRDRSDLWIDYNKSNWQEGIEEFTEYTLIK